jgi:hypothetical protein
MGLIRGLCLVLLVGGVASAQGIAVGKASRADRVQPTTLPPCNSSQKGLRVNSSSNVAQVCDGFAWTDASPFQSAASATAGAKWSVGCTPFHAQANFVCAGYPFNSTYTTIAGTVTNPGTLTDTKTYAGGLYIKAARTAFAGQMGFLGNNTSHSISVATNPVYEQKFRFTSPHTDWRLCVALGTASGGCSNLNADTGAGQNDVYLRLNRNQGWTTWRCCTQTGASEQCTDSGVAFVDDAINVARLKLTHTAQTVWLNGTQICSLSRALDTTAQGAQIAVPSVAATTTAATAGETALYIGGMWMTWDTAL